MSQYNKPANKGQRLASLAQALYLTNITILPIISFVLLIFIYFKEKSNINDQVLNHFRQSILANIVAAFLLLVVSIAILLLGSLNSVYTWILLILYFICVHSILILFGVFALIKAWANQRYYYPLFGRIWM